MQLSIEQIRGAVNKACDGKDISRIPDDGHLREFGFDSLDMFNIFLEIEALSGRSIPDEDIEHLQSIQSMYEYVNGNSL
jgi:acyl carrier protein